MRPSDLSPLHAEHRFRADVVALCCGIVVLFLAPIVTKYARPDQLGIAILLLIISSALAAGFIAVAYLNRAKLSSVDASHVIRAGARSGLLAATLSAAMTVLAARLFRSQLAAIVVLVPALLSILPASFFGMLATAYAVGVRFPLVATSDAKAAPPNAGRLPVVALLAAVAPLGFASVLMPQSAERVVTTSTQLTPGSTATAWRYEKPADLASAPASRWDFSITRPIGRVREGSPVVLSPTGDRLAYVDGEASNTVKVVELNQPDATSAFPFTGSLNRMVFSPTSDQILFDAFQENRRLGVIDLKKRRVIMLPRPKGQILPTGDLLWLTPLEATFRTLNSPHRALDLDMLELGDSAKQSIPAGPGFPATAVAAVEFRRGLNSIVLPYDLKQRDASVAGAPQVTVRDTQHDYRRFFPIETQLGDRFAAATDGSKLIRIRNDQIVVSYVTLRPKPVVMLRLDMSLKPDDHSDKNKVTSALAAGDLCAFVYAPLVNPLNDKVIGPDRDHIKAVLRFESWTDRTASTWIVEEHQPVSSTDVVADLHTWKNSRPELVLEPERRWWTKVSIQRDSQREPADAPVATVTRPLQRDLQMQFVAEQGVLRLRNIDEAPAREPASASASPTPTPLGNFASRADVTQSAPVPAIQSTESSRVLDPDEPAFQMISTFIEGHHQKANRGDLSALINDYADQVLFFNKGTVDRAYIYKNESMSRAGFIRMAESIIYPITVQQYGGNQYNAGYSIAWEAVKKDGRRSNGTSTVNLTIAGTAHGLKIISHTNTPEGDL